MTTKFRVIRYALVIALVFALCVLIPIVTYRDPLEWTSCYSASFSALNGKHGIRLGLEPEFKTSVLVRYENGTLFLVMIQRSDDGKLPIYKSTRFALWPTDE